MITQRIISLKNKPCLETLLNSIRKEYDKFFSINIIKQNKTSEIIIFEKQKNECKLLEKWKLDIIVDNISIIISIYKNVNGTFLAKIRHGAFLRKTVEPFLENFFEVFYSLGGEEYKKLMYYCNEKEAKSIFG